MARNIYVSTTFARKSSETPSAHQGSLRNPPIASHRRGDRCGAAGPVAELFVQLSVGGDEAVT